MYVSGSTDIPQAALLFFKDGTMSLSAAELCDKSDMSSLMLVTDYFSYALTRVDWMSDYVNQIKKDHDGMIQKKRVSFRVIQGGITGSVDI